MSTAFSIWHGPDRNTPDGVSHAATSRKIFGPLDSERESNWYTGMSEGFHLERDRAYRRIVDLILCGDVEPDGPLSERRLADSLDIGRMPVREALRDLARDGVLEVRPARGTYVRALSVEDVREIYEVRYGLEGVAASLAAERGATPALSACGPRFREMLDRPENFSLEETYEIGAQFHTEIFRAAGNRQLLQIYEPIRLRFRLALRLPRYYDHDRVRESVKEHMGILAAIEAGDGQEARRLIVEHLAKGLEARRRLFEQLAGSRAAPFAIDVGAA